MDSLAAAAASSIRPSSAAYEASGQEGVALVARLGEASCAVSEELLRCPEVSGVGGGVAGS